MFSVLRKGLIYNDISPDILEHDEDIDADQWVYDDREVYRGRFDPRYTEHNLHVYWLYDDNLNRVGLAEHEADNQADYKALWFMDNSFATLYQDESWVSKDKTLWSLMPNEAYQDCLEDDFKTVFDRCLTSKYRIVTPDFLIKPPTVYECTKCGKKSLKSLKNCKDVVETSYFSNSNFVFVDDSFIVYEKSTLQPPASSEPEPEQQQVREPPQPEHPHPPEREQEHPEEHRPLLRTDPQPELESSGTPEQHEASK